MGNSHTVHGATSPIRPKNILVILAGRKPHTKISMIVNKRSVLSMEQLILDVSKSLGKFSKSDLFYQSVKGVSVDSV